MESNLPTGGFVRAERGGGASISRAGTLALLAAHCAGMVDLVALPVWVGTLIGSYHLDAQQAGALVTLFLAGAVASSVYFASRLNRLPGRVAASASFGLAALAFLGMTVWGDSYAAMAGLHAGAGLSVGCSLSLTHGTIGRSRNPHRLFAAAGVALGCFAIAFLGLTPGVVAAHGGPALFKVFAGVMALAAALCGLAFPGGLRQVRDTSGTETRLAPEVWSGMVGVGCMGLTQAMVFSFVQRIGMDHGFGLASVTSVLIALGLVNLLPAPLAALLELHVPARRVVMTGPLVQAMLALVITNSSTFAPYAAATAVFAAVMIFTHTFAFGVLARMDATGRAVAATPAMLMTGAAIGPIVGGTLVKFLGYESLGMATILTAAAAIGCFARLGRNTVSAGASA
ncbi:MFS transporter [Ralstonia sp. 22086]|uniref:MFS transporter n=1 Tax=Ralstonia sp. 22086 TaxID=3453870 RepID=UPI003F84C14F